jgi:putative nucleotidyltransferase-like protein
MASHSRLQELLFELDAALGAAGIEHALIGGLALAPRGFPRGTKDIDFLIHENAVERVRALMRVRGAEPIQEDAEFSTYLDGGIRADFQHARREISQSMLARAEPVAFAGATIPVLQAEDLIGLKVQASWSNPARLQDFIDIERLLGANRDTLDLDRVRTYFKLFDREKDLDRALGLVAPKDR